MRTLLTILFLIVALTGRAQTLSGNVAISGNVSVSSVVYSPPSPPPSFYLTPSQYAATPLSGFLDWGTYTFLTNGESVVPQNVNPSFFNPGVDAVTLSNNLVSAVSLVPVGGKVVFTVKTQDGYCMWPTTFTNGTNVSYSIASSAWYATNIGFNPVKIVAQACTNQGKYFVPYFNMADATLFAQTNIVLSTAAGLNYYSNMLAHEWAEILSYAPVAAQFCDTWGGNAAGYSPPGGINGYTYISQALAGGIIHGLSSNTIILDNNLTPNITLTNAILPMEEWQFGNTAGPLNWGPVNANTNADVNDNCYFNKLHWYFDPLDVHAPQNYMPPRQMVNYYREFATNNSSYTLAIMLQSNGAPDSGQFSNWLQYADNLIWSNNIALGAVVTVSSTNSGGGSTNPATLTSGNIYQNYNNPPIVGLTNALSFVIGNGETPMWAQVDLGANKLISRMEAYNRQDNGYAGCLSDITFQIYDANTNLVWQSQVLNPGNIIGGGNCSAGPAQLSANTGDVMGRFARVTRSATTCAAQLPLTGIGLFAANASKYSFMTNLPDMSLTTLSNANWICPPGSLITIPAGTDYISLKALVFTNDSLWHFPGTNVSALVDEMVSRNSYLIIYGKPGTNVMEISGVTFRGGVTNTGQNFSGCINQGGVNVLIDHCTLDNLNGDNVGIYDAMSCVWSGNTVINPFNIAFESFGTLPHGETNWATSYQYDDGASSVYIENNICYGSHRGFYDSEYGGRGVVRFNWLHNDFIATHGSETGLPIFGFRFVVIYGNTETNDSNWADPINIRGGTGMAFNNTNYNTTSLGIWSDDRNSQAYFLLGGEDGTNSWDTNDPTVYFSGTINTNDGLNVNGESTFYLAGANWTPGQWAGYTIRDLTQARFSVIPSSGTNFVTVNTPQGLPKMVLTNGDLIEIRHVIKGVFTVGNGAGDLIINNGSTAYNVVTGAPSWPRQIHDPFYVWGNMINGTNSSQVSSQPNIPVGTDTNLDSIVLMPKPGYTPFTYPHPLTLTYH